jgi:hypothetical protein
MAKKIETPCSANAKETALFQFLVSGRATESTGCNTGTEWGLQQKTAQLQASKPERNKFL